MTPYFAILGLGSGELIMILVIALVLFGATKLPKLARSMGQSVGEFKQGLKDAPRDLGDSDKDSAAK